MNFNYKYIIDCFQSCVDRQCFVWNVKKINNGDKRGLETPSLPLFSNVDEPLNEKAIKIAFSSIIIFLKKPRRELFFMISFGVFFWRISFKPFIISVLFTKILLFVVKSRIYVNHSTTYFNVFFFLI